MKFSNRLLSLRKAQRLSLFPGFLLFLCLSFSLPSHAQTIPVPIHSILSETILSDTSFVISDPAEFDGFFYTFHIHSDFGNFSATSLQGLEYRLHEIEILEQFRVIRSDKEILKGVGGSIVGVGKGLVFLASHPVRSAKQIPRGIVKFAKRIITFGKRHPREKKKSFLKKISGPAKRSIAAKLDLDLYTDNQAIQKMLDKLAKYRTFGKGALTVSTFFLLSGPASVVYSVGGINNTVKNIIENNNLRELYALNHKELRTMKIDTATSQEFLKNLNFSPSDQTFIIQALKAIPDTAGRKIIFSKIKGAQNKKKAYFYLRSVLSMLKTHETIEPLAQLTWINGFLSALGKHRDTRYFFLPADRVTLTPQIKSILNSFALNLNLNGNYESKSLITGPVSQDAKDFLKELEISIE